ncbi:MAG: PQQ-binding-like beta-propeller repeat protein [Clostridia bacterium]
MALAALAAFSPLPAAAQSPRDQSPEAQAPGATASGGQSEAEILFRFPVGGVVTTGPVVGGTRVWFISDSRTLYVLDSAGKAIGRRPISYRRVAFIACDPFGRAVIPEEPSILTMINRAGQTVWTLDLGVPASGLSSFGPPSFGPDGRLYVLAGRFLSAYAPNGRRLWRDELPLGAVGTVHTGPGGGPVLMLADGSLRLWSQDGQPLWNFPAGSDSPLATGSAVQGALLVADDQALAFALPDGRIFRLDAQGQLSWYFKAPPSPAVIALVPDAKCLVAGRDGSLSMVGPAGLLWRTPAKSGFVAQGAALAVYDGRYVLTWKGGAVSYGTDGDFYRELNIRNPATPPAMAPGGTVFSGGVDWIMYAYRFERGLPSPAASVVPGLDRQAVRQAAREEAFWTPGAVNDDVLLTRLADIEKSLKSGTIGGEAQNAILYAAAVALGDFEAPFGSGSVSPGPVPRGPLPRAMACQTLGELGSTRALPVLVEVFQRDPEPVVRAAAALAVAAIGLDPDGTAQDAFARAASEGLDPRTAAAVIDAIEGLYRSNGALDNLAGALALARLAVGNYPRDLRARAETALRSVSAPR